MTKKSTDKETSIGDIKSQRDVIVGDQYVFLSSQEVENIENLDPTPGEAPYKGLKIYDEIDASLFFGRRKLIGQLLQKTGRTNFLAIIGASGSGKSSVLRAGLIPALKSGKPVEGVRCPVGSRDWLYQTVNPANRPLLTLATVLSSDNEERETLAKRMLNELDLFRNGVLELTEQKQAERLFLAIDQFEEIFTLCSDQTERSAFLSQLLGSTAPNIPITVVITLRADFYGHCGSHEQLRQMLTEHQVYIGAMNQDELYDAIVQPLLLSNRWRIQVGLADLLRDEIGEEPGALSLLSHALLETWNRRRGVTMTLSGYQEAGGLKGAITKTAEDIYLRKFDQDQQAICRSIFLRLTQLGDGTQETRRRATLNEILTSMPDEPKIKAVKNILEVHRLLTAGQDPQTGEDILEVSHEALIRHWDRLHEWLDEDRRLLRMRQEVRSAAIKWLDSNKKDEYLDHRDERLKQARVLLEHSHITLDEKERLYLDACERANRNATASIEKMGWGVIFASDADPAVRYALRELLDHRKAQVSKGNPAYYQEFIGERGYRQGQSKREFFKNLGIGSGKAKPDQMPNYLLIVGDPETIPFSFQYQLDTQYAVGRICFETLEEYAQYARSVVLAETADFVPNQRLAIFCVRNPDDRATQMSLTQLAIPLVSELNEKLPSWQVDEIFAEKATKAALKEIINGDDVPALFFSLSHGMNFKQEDARILEHTGALLCQDWPGIKAHVPITEALYFSRDDVSPDAHLLGSIFYLWSCYSAGIPSRDNFYRQAFGEQKQISPYAFISKLPQRLLSHPNGGALAVIGKVERAWGSSFVEDGSIPQVGVFTSAMSQLMEEYPVGIAMEVFNQRYMTVVTDLVEMLDKYEETRDEVQLAGMWTTVFDARNYIILGDPAVRLRVDKEGTSVRPVITPGLILDESEKELENELGQAAANWAAEKKVAGLLHRADTLVKIKAFGSLFYRDQGVKSYLQACEVYEQIEQAAQTWATDQRQKANLIQEQELLEVFSTSQLLIEDEIVQNYLDASQAYLQEQVKAKEIKSNKSDVAASF